MCFVQTTELDGERNLKPIVGSSKVSAWFDKFLAKNSNLGLKGRFIKPTKSMYYYQGEITVESEGKSDQVAVDLKMFLHRGAVLRNSGSVYALVT